MPFVSRMLPAVAGSEAALAPGAPLLHEGVAGNLCYDWELGDKAGVNGPEAGLVLTGGLDGGVTDDGGFGRGAETRLAGASVSEGGSVGEAVWSWSSSPPGVGSLRIQPTSMTEP